MLGAVKEDEAIGIEIIGDDSLRVLANSAPTIVRCRISMNTFHDKHPHGGHLGQGLRQLLQCLPGDEDELLRLHPQRLHNLCRGHCRLQIGCFCGALAKDADGTGMYVVSQSKEQTPTGQRVTQQMALPPRVQGVQLCIGVITSLLIHHSTQEGISRWRVNTISLTMSHTQQPHPRPTNELTF